MTTYQHCAGTVHTVSAGSKSGERTSVFRKIAEYLRKRSQLRENRAAFNSMLYLEDRMLKDIGVTREDVKWASQLPLNMNAAEELRRLSQKSGTFLM